MSNPVFRFWKKLIRAILVCRSNEVEYPDSLLFELALNEKKGNFQRTGLHDSFFIQQQNLAELIFVERMSNQAAPD